MLQPALSVRTAGVALLSVSLLAACSTTKVQAPVSDHSPSAVSAATPVPAPAPPAPPAKPTTYTVKKGDTVYSIANQFGLEPRQLAAWNDLDPQYHLRIDQTLQLVAPVAPEGAQATAIAPSVVEQHPLGATAAPADHKPKAGPSGLKRPYSDAALAEMSRPEGSAPPEAPATAPSPAVAAMPPAVPPAEGDNADQVTWGWPASGPVIAEFNDTRNPGINISGKAGTPVVAAADGRVIFAGQGPRGYGSMVIIKNSPNLLSVYAHNSKLLVAEQDNVRRGQKIAEMGDSEAERVELHFEIRVQSKPVDPLKYLPGR